MEKERELFYLGVKLSLPLNEEQSEAFLWYIEFIETEAAFVPFVVFKLVYDYNKNEFLTYDKEIFENILSEDEKKIFMVYFKSIKYLFDSSDEFSPEFSKETILSLIDFINREISFLDINMFKLNLKDIPPPPDVFINAEAVFLDERTKILMGKYFRKWEELLFSKSFLEEIIIKYRLSKEKLKETSKELIFAILKFLNIINDIYSYNFRLRKIFGKIIVNHSNYKYPIGGYSEISRGQEEPDKLLFSELAYLDENVGGIDLFTIKYVERDLLFLVKDDNEFYGAGISFIFDLHYIKLFLKDRGEYIPEYFLILVFIISVVKIVEREIYDIRTFFVLKNVPPSIKDVVYYFIPSAIDYDSAIKEGKMPEGIRIYTVFNGKVSKEVEANLYMRVDIDIDTVNIFNKKVRLFDKREIGKTLKNSREIIRSQIKSNYISSLLRYFEELV